MMNEYDHARKNELLASQRSPIYIENEGRYYLILKEITKFNFSKSTYS